ncbi:MAG: Glutathione transport system permease protein GsiD [Anaerolineae bacterium]|nr:Glutathione transport system permease protein GsiD [Anaerolineae bacterium]
MTTADTALSSIPALAKSKEPSSLYKDALRHLMQKQSAIVGMVILAILTAVAILAPLIAPFDPELQLIGKEDGIKKRSAPCVHMLGCSTELPQHVFGVDANFRDFFSRVVYGARLSLVVGFASVTIAIISGTILGSVAGFLGGWVDNVIMRLMDVLLAFPALILAIAIVTVMGPGLINALIAISIVTIPMYARVIRSSVLTVKEQDYVLAGQSVGVPQFRILYRDILPNAITPLIVQGTLGIGTAIVEVAALSFLGLGAQPPTPEWGLMVSSERNQIFTAPHLVLIPGICIALVVLGFNLLGDGLQDALNPRLNRR